MVQHGRGSAKGCSYRFSLHRTLPPSSAVPVRSLRCAESCCVVMHDRELQCPLKGDQSFTRQFFRLRFFPASSFPRQSVPPLNLFPSFFTPLLLFHYCSFPVFFFIVIFQPGISTLMAIFWRLQLVWFRLFRFAWVWLELVRNGLVRIGKKWIG